MIKRNVSFQLMADGSVTPSVPQYGGVKGEHNVTTVGFILNTNAVSVEGDVVRLSFYTGDGAVLSTDLLEDITVDAATNHAYIRYLLPKNLTMAGGQLCARLVMSRMDEDGNEVEVFRSGEAVLYFDEAPVENGTPFWTGVSEMLHRTASAKDAAVAAQASAASSAESAESRRALAQLAQYAARGAADEAQAACAEANNQNEAARQAALLAAQHCTAAEQAATASEESRQSATAAANMAFAHRQGADAAAQTATEAAQAAEEAAQKASQITGVGNGLGLEDGKVFVDPTYIDGKISTAVSSVYRFKGSVANYTELTAVQNSQIGDVYNVTDDGMNYAWTGEIWDALGSQVTAKDSMSGTSNESGVPVSGVAVAQYVQKALENTGGGTGAGDGVALTDDEIIAIVKNAGFARVYFGSGEMPDGYDIQIDPDGDVMDDSYIQGMIDKAIAAYDAEAMALLGEDEVTA